MNEAYSKIDNWSSDGIRVYWEKDKMYLGLAGAFHGLPPEYLKIHREGMERLATMITQFYFDQDVQDGKVRQ